MNQFDDRYAFKAARLLAGQRQGVAPLAAEPATDTRRDALVAAMALAIAEKTRRRRILRASAVGLALAASVALVVGLKRNPGGSANHTIPGFFVEHEIGRDNQLVRGGAMQPLPDLAAIVAGDAIRSGELGGATLAAGSGTRITLGGGSHLRADELAATRRFTLLAGQLDAQVAKLGAGERFIVDTPDGEVEVRGTRFTVAVADSAPACAGLGPVSTVKVSEGAVAVRFASGQLLLHPGDVWTAPCPTGQAPGAKATRAVPVPAAVEPAPTPARPAVRRPATTHPAMATTAHRELAAEGPEAQPMEGAPAASSLAAQNDLFQAALAAERMGQSDVAIGKLDELLRRFAHGPLGESARAERTRILSAQGRAP
jgi:hypothetical protein